MADFTAQSNRFCRNPEQFGDGTVAALKLHTNRPTWYLRDELPWMNRAELESVIQAAADRWTDVCDFKAVKSANEASALWVFTVARMDGPGGVLADAELPSNGRQQRCRIDVAENALRGKLVTILCHEIGHLMGLQHFPANPPPELMEPRLSNITHPQATESALCVQWYGKPITQPSPPTVPQPTNGLTCVMRLADNGIDATCSIEAAKPGYQMKLATAQPKKWEPVAAQGIYVAAHPAQEIQLPVIVPETWDNDPTDLEPGELT